MAGIEQVEAALLQFRKDRNWEQFHNPKDIAISLSLEAAEVLEHFQWKKPEEIAEYTRDHKDDIAEEMADVINWIILLAHDLDIDIIEASLKKITKNAGKYPIEKAQGNHKKYDELS
jgi:dCTP diphosphatase